MAEANPQSPALCSSPQIEAIVPTAILPFSRCTRSGQICWPQIWRRGWDLNPHPPLKARILLILRYATNAKNAQSANRRYTAGTRNTDLPNASNLTANGQTPGAGT